MEGYELQRTGQWTWELPATGGMLVPGRIYADESLDRGSER